MENEVAELKAEVRRLNKIVRDLTEAVAILAAKDARAQRFVEEIRRLGVPDEHTNHDVLEQ